MLGRAAAPLLGSHDFSHARGTHVVAQTVRRSVGVDEERRARVSSQPSAAPRAWNICVLLSRTVLAVEYEPSTLSKCLGESWLTYCADAPRVCVHSS